MAAGKDEAHRTVPTMCLVFTPFVRIFYSVRMFERWFYISTSRWGAAQVDEQIRTIVDVSRPRNRLLGVTGALLFTGRRFAQYLEGSPAAIAELKQSIIRDVRHEDVRTIASGPYDVRRFLTWSLAYAGPSRFIANMVEDALDDELHGNIDSVEPLAEVLAGFAVEGHS
ncbi:BLUF domain-containing protein [Sphingobium herbicidovorans]|uniref:BLUF domain-containing protein n=1 Tax=Sphingobium herbicidovorans TaxID=76947 RepID=UPI001F230904|nr:BLUF domain-containing protein [Sphingobium herbicidovorans]